MGFDVAALKQAVARHGRVTRVVIAAVRGSSPREVGAAMLVWGTRDNPGQSGTIGGGALEYEAAAAARRQTEPKVLRVQALGPNLGQCCGGSVTLLSEIYTATGLERLAEDVIARPVVPGPMPLAVSRILAAARNQGRLPEPQLAAGWMIEPVHRPAQPLWIWGAGHVGRALVDVLAPLPGFDITWVDTAASRFPAEVPPQVTTVAAAEPAVLVPHVPENAGHLVLTYSHALDLALCHALLTRGFAFAGLIGSKTKWARFRARLAALGHSPAAIARITCPIGDPALGKHPQMIAVGVAAELLRKSANNENREDRRA